MNERLSLYFSESGFKIQWVDDTHALGIFSSPSTGTVPWFVVGPTRCGGFLCSGDPGLMHWVHRSHTQLVPEAVGVHHGLLPLERLFRLGKLAFPWLGVETLLCESSRFLIALDRKWGTFCVRSGSRCVAGQESVPALRFVCLGAGQNTCKCPGAAWNPQVGPQAPGTLTLQAQGSAIPDVSLQQRALTKSLRFFLGI